MTKRKFKVFIDIVLILLCLFPLIITTAICLRNGTFYSSGDFTELVQRFAISTELSEKIGECINTFGIAFDGAYFPAVCVIMANSLIIYLCYLFVSVLVFLPKLAIKWLNSEK